MANLDDREGILKLVEENAKLLGKSPDNFNFAADFILKDINYGFFIIATTEDNTPVGFMLFTYEWSDWRNGLFFWLQSVHVVEAFRRSGVLS